jgi:hypothetical protein
MRQNVDKGEETIGSLLCIQPFCVLPKLYCGNTFLYIV